MPGNRDVVHGSEGAPLFPTTHTRHKVAAKSACRGIYKTMYVCMSPCVYVCMYVCIYIYIHACIHIVAGLQQGCRVEGFFEAVVGFCALFRFQQQGSCFLTRGLWG